MKVSAFIVLVCVVALSAGCSKFMPHSTATFQINGFTTTEKTHDATSYSKAWNSFKSKGTLIATGIPDGQAALVMLQAKDQSDGPNPNPQLVTVLVRNGTAKLDINKSNYGEKSKRPDYKWSVVGWVALKKGAITSVN